MEVKEITQELVQLVYQLDQFPGNRIPILERVAELEAELDTR